MCLHKWPRRCSTRGCCIAGKVEPGSTWCNALHFPNALAEVEQVTATCAWNPVKHLSCRVKGVAGVELSPKCWYKMYKSRSAYCARVSEYWVASIHQLSMRVSVLTASLYTLFLHTRRRHMPEKCSVMGVVLVKHLWYPVKSFWPLDFSTWRSS